MNSDSDSTIYVIHPKKNNESKSVWKHFYVSKDKQSAKCKYFPNKIIMTRGGSTKGMHKHFSARHQKTKKEMQLGPTQGLLSSAENDEVSNEDEPQPSTSSSVSSQFAPKTKIPDYFLIKDEKEDNSLDAVLA